MGGIHSINLNHYQNFYYEKATGCRRPFCYNEHFANPTEPLTKNTVNEKVLTAFKETFSSATNPVWHEYEDHYIVKFNQDEIDTRIKYDLEGKISETVRYYKEDALPLIL